MSDERLQIAKAYYEAMNEKNLAKLKQYLRPDAKLISPMAGEAEGSSYLEAVSRFMASFTIDNIPKSAYDQYAKNAQYQSGPVQIQSASKLSKDAAIPVATIVRAPEAEDKFNIGRNQVLALFPEPPVSPEKMKFFFTHELTPSFGTSAQIQELIDQVAVKGEQLKDPADLQAFQTINTALETALKLGRTLEWINNKRLEFSKG